MLFKENFEIIAIGSVYAVPQYKVQEGTGLEETGKLHFIHFVRGSTMPDDEVPAREGTLHEHLLAVMIHDLKLKNQLVPSRESSLAITKLEEALHWMRARTIDRAQRQVQGTYKP